MTVSSYWGQGSPRFSGYVMLSVHCSAFLAAVLITDPLSQYAVVDVLGWWLDERGAGMG